MKSRALWIMLAAGLAAAQNWQTAAPGYRFEFPRDHFSHPNYETEWWYYTGNLHSPDGHRYGFELTFFRQGARIPKQAAVTEGGVWLPDQLYLAHLALSDLDGHTFYHTERLNRRGPGLAGAGEEDAAYWNGNWQVRWTSLPAFTQELSAVCDRFTLKLALTPGKPPVIQGENGVSVKGPDPGQASHYISFTRLHASGRLQEKGLDVPVAGLAWMDHEFFTEPPANNLSGWDWFAIQLDNNEELMLYRLRTKSGTIDKYSSGGYVDSQGQQHYLSQSDFQLTPGKRWKSSRSGASYPLQWSISVPALKLDLNEETTLKDQELWQKDSLSPSYWEGAVSYGGTRASKPIHGVGYLEMTGYGGPVRLSGMSR